MRYLGCKGRTILHKICSDRGHDLRDGFEHSTSHVNSPGFCRNETGS